MLRRWWHRLLRRKRYRAITPDEIEVQVVWGPDGAYRVLDQHVGETLAEITPESHGVKRWLRS